MSTTAVDSLLKTRFSCRHYLPTPVPRSTIENIIDAARHSPSSSNLQCASFLELEPLPSDDRSIRPWAKVYCLSGDALASVSNDMLEAYRDDPTGHRAEYDSFPADMPTTYALRRHEFGGLYYGAYGVEQHDAEGRRRVMENNYKFYGAPVGLVFTMDRRLGHSSWLNVGYFLQSVSIAARARGLETISLQAIADFHKLIRPRLHISDDQMIVVGMAIGYPDLDKVGKFNCAPQKRPLSDIAEFLGFEEA